MNPRRPRRWGLAFLLALLAMPAWLRAGGERAVKVVFWHANNPAEVRFARRAVEAFHAHQDRIEVEARRIPSSRSSEEVLLAAILSGTTPDVCANVSTGILPKLSRARALIDLDPIREHLEVRAGRPLPPGEIPSVPWKSNPVMLYHNRALLRQLGRRHPPRDHEDLLALGARLEERFPAMWLMNPSARMTWWERFFDFYPFYLAASGGRTLLDAEGRAAFATPAAAGVLELFRRGFAAGYFPRSPPIRDLFMDGEMLLRAAGPHYLPELEHENDRRRRVGEEPLEFGVGPIPVPVAGPVPAGDEGGPGGRRDGHAGAGEGEALPWSFVDRKDIVVFSTCEHPDAARDFVRFLTDPVRDAWFLEETYQVPLRRGIEHLPETQALLREVPPLFAFCRQAARTRPLDRTEHLVQIFDILSAAYEAAGIYGVVEPAAALDEAAAQVDYLVENWR